MAGVSVGKICFTIVALAGSVGSFVSDWSPSHMKNPKWPPHAKFHNAQTLSFGAVLGMLIVYEVWRPKTSVEEASRAITQAAVYGSLYWLTGLASWFFPRTAGVDPEFGTGFPQLPFFLGWWAINGLGYVLEQRRLAML